jgi:peptidoglycan/LPS O-acetylase OafA/YrhL
MGQRVLGTQPAKLLTLQVLRAVAANLVVLQHLNQFETKYAGGPIPFVQYGDIGVDLFFVISGFVMVAVAGRMWERCNFFRAGQREFIRPGG